MSRDPRRERLLSQLTQLLEDRNTALNLASLPDPVPPRAVWRRRSGQPAVEVVRGGTFASFQS